MAGQDVFSIPPLQPFSLLYKDQSTITVSLQTNKHFDLIITAYNGYGNISTTVAISNFILEKTLLHIDHVHTSFPGRYI